MGGARLNPRAVREAIELLGLTFAVEIKWANGTRRRGAHRFRRVPAYLGREATWKHVITLSTYLKAEQINETLWHELTHAAQQEEHGDEFDDLYWADRRARGYAGSIYENEAREYAATFATELPLAA